MGSRTEQACHGIELSPSCAARGRLLESPQLFDLRQLRIPWRKRRLLLQALRSVMWGLFLLCLCLQWMATRPLLLVRCSGQWNKICGQEEDKHPDRYPWPAKTKQRFLRMAKLLPRTWKPLRTLPFPQCGWCWKTSFGHSRRLWSAWVGLGPKCDLHPALNTTAITIQCVSCSCEVPTCLQNNLSVEVCSQDLYLFLIWPPVSCSPEGEPVQLGWCACLSIAQWPRHHRNRWDNPITSLLLPTGYHPASLPRNHYPGGQLSQWGTSYFNYHLTEYYQPQGLYIPSLHVKQGPRHSLGPDLHVEPTVLHLFSARSKLLSISRKTVRLSWNVSLASPQRKAYRLLDAKDHWIWSTTYNPYALQRNYSLAPSPLSSRKQAMASLYLDLDEGEEGELSGAFDSTGATLGLRFKNKPPAYLVLSAGQIKTSTWVFSPSQGLYYFITEGNAPAELDPFPSIHRVFYQQQSLSYLVTIEFDQWRRYRFSVHLYLNRKGALMRPHVEKYVEIRFFNSGPSLVPGVVSFVWFIPLQHPFLHHKWSFHLQVFDVEKDDLLWNNTYNYEDRVQSAARFIPRDALPFHPALYAGFVAQVGCTRVGQMLVILKTMIGTSVSKVLKSTVGCLQRVCFLEKVKIQKPDPTNPLLNYSKKAPFILSADTAMNCPGPKRTHISWKIYKVPDLKTDPDWSKPLQLPGIRRKDLTMLQVPAASIDEGLYLFNLTVKLSPLDNLEKVEDSDSVFVRIRPDRHSAVSAGGSWQKINTSEQGLRSGSASLAAGTPRLLEGLTFSWYCTRQKGDYLSMSLSAKGKCHPDQVDLKWATSSEPVPLVLPKPRQDNAVYYVLLVVHKGQRRAPVGHTVHEWPDSALALQATCTGNCAWLSRPAGRRGLSARCHSCKRFHSPRYHWPLFSGSAPDILFDSDSRSSRRREKTYICVNPFGFDMEHLAGPLHRLVLKASMERHKSSLYNYPFVVTSPPGSGKCHLKPPRELAFPTKFMTHCSGFIEKHLSLQSKVKVILDPVKQSKMPGGQKRTLGASVYFGNRSEIPPSFLPFGASFKQYLLTVNVEVYDALGAYSQITLQTAIHGPLKGRKMEVVLKKLHSLTSGTTAPILYFLSQENYFSAGYFVYMVACTLNDMKILPRLHSSKTQLRETLLNWSAGIPTTNLMEANRMISSIFQITREITEVNEKSQLLAVRKLKEVTEGLRGPGRRNQGSKAIDLLGTAILAGLSNVLKASLSKTTPSRGTLAKETICIIESLTDLVLQGKDPGENETIVEAEDWTITLRKVEKHNLSGAFDRGKGCKTCFYPKMKQVEYDRLPEHGLISTVLYEFDKISFPWLPSSDGLSTRVAGFKMAGAQSNGDLLELTPDVAEMILPRNEDKMVTFEMTMERGRTSPKAIGGFSLEVCRKSKDILIQILTKQEHTFQVFIYVGLRVNHLPVTIFSVSHHLLAESKTKDFTRDNCAFQTPYVFCLSQTMLKSIFHGSRAEKLNVSVVFQSDHFLEGRDARRLSLILFTANCLYLDRVETLWKEGVCHLGPQTTWQKLHCICPGKRRTARTADPQPKPTSQGQIMFLAGKVSVYPNPAEMRKTQLSQIQKNPLATLAVLFIFLAYIFLAIWAMRKDRADVESRVHAIVLSDNDPFDKVCYLLTIYTGRRFGAGTTANVFIQLIGDQAVSDVHCLSHPEYRPFLRGAISTFLLTTRNDLGEIYCVQAWHDNAGASPNWFLSRMKVENMYTNQCWVFVCRKWLALDKDDGLIERAFVVTQPTAPLNKMDFFLISLADDLTDNHLWLSIFAPVCAGSFNRLQRLSCCLAIVFCVLLINMVFFRADMDQQIFPGELQYWRLVIIGTKSAFISIPLQMIITALFKYSQKEPPTQKAAETWSKEGSPFTPANFRTWREFLQECYLHKTDPKSPRSHLSDPHQLQEQAKTRRNQRVKSRHNCTLSEGAANVIATEEDGLQDTRADINFSNNYVEKEVARPIRSLNVPSILFCKRPQVISWWNRYASWVLVLVISTASSFFIILYGLSQDGETLLEWLAASAISLFVSVFLLQTLNILFFSALKTLYPKSCENIPWSSKETFLEIKLNDLTMNADDMRELHYDLVRLRGSKQYQPLEEDEITIFKKREKIRRQAFVFLKDVICHFVFLILILNIAYSMENTTSYYYNQDIRTRLSEGLSGVSKVGQVYAWLTKVFLPLTHNDLKPTFLPGTWSKILGLPQMRQIRASNTKKECFYPHSFVNKFVISKSHCLHKYGFDQEDRRHHLGSWKKQVNTSAAHPLTGFTYHSVMDPWRYHSYGELNTYEASGYTLRFYPEEPLSLSIQRVEMLEESGWLDENTWALIVEMTTFNSDVDLFCSISIVFEISNLGPINTTVWIHSYKLPIFKQLKEGEKFVFMAVGYMLVFYIIDEFCVVEQQRLKYIKNISNLINFGIKTVCLFFLLQLGFKFKLASSLIELHQHHPDKFIPFHKVSQVDKTLRITLGFLAFLIVLKTLRYSRFFYDVRLAQRSILAALPGICSMALVVAVYFFVYMAFGYLVFGQYEWNYNTMTHSAQTVFSYCVSAFKDTAFTSNRALGGLFLASFMMVMICVLINLFQAVIMSAYEDMKQPVYEEPSDEAEVVNFLFHKIRQIWSFVTCRPVPTTTDTELFNRVLFGIPERRNIRHLGLKARKINGRKMVYLVI